MPHFSRSSYSRFTIVFNDNGKITERDVKYEGNKIIVK